MIENDKEKTDLVLSDDFGGGDHFEALKEAHQYGGCYNSDLEFDYEGSESIVYKPGFDARVRE